MRLNMYYILDENQQPVPVMDIEEWAKWYEDMEHRRVAKTQVGAGCEVSTVFLALDHSLGDSEVPILYETLVFGGPLDMDMERYATREEAEAGHEQMVQRVQAALQEA